MSETKKTAIIGYYSSLPGLTLGNPFYMMRGIEPENFNPMTHDLLDPQTMVQVYTDVVGGQAWINIYKRDIKRI